MQPLAADTSLPLLVLNAFLTTPIMNAVSPTHCLFAGAPDGKILDVASIPKGGRINRYRVDAVGTVKGTSPTAPQRGWPMIRVEAESPTDLAAPVTYYGVTEHLQYTTASQAASLAHSHGEFSAAGDSIRAVLIPIHKDDAWWSLPHDKRQNYFSETPSVQGHTKIGEMYIDRVFRKLYHSRYLGRKSPYDFLTYFEFHQTDEGRFRELLAKLRDPAVNPEWRYVDLEFEIWMTKLT